MDGMLCGWYCCETLRPISHFELLLYGESYRNGYGYTQLLRGTSYSHLHCRYRAVPVVRCVLVRWPSHCSLHYTDQGPNGVSGVTLVGPAKAMVGQAVVS